MSACYCLTSGVSSRDSSPTELQRQHSAGRNSIAQRSAVQHKLYAHAGAPVVDLVAVARDLKALARLLQAHDRDVCQPLLAWGVCRLSGGQQCEEGALRIAAAAVDVQRLAARSAARAAKGPTAALGVQRRCSIQPQGCVRRLAARFAPWRGTCRRKAAARCQRAARRRHAAAAAARHRRRCASHASPTGCLTLRDIAAPLARRRAAVAGGKRVRGSVLSRPACLKGLPVQIRYGPQLFYGLGRDQRG